MSRRTLRCLRCGGTMELLRREFLQLGKTGWVLGDLDNLLAVRPAYADDFYRMVLLDFVTRQDDRISRTWR